MTSFQNHKKLGNFSCFEIDTRISEFQILTKKIL